MATPYQITKKLHRAARRNDVRKVKKFIKKLQASEHDLMHKYDILHCAIKGDAINVVRWYVNKISGGFFDEFIRDEPEYWEGIMKQAASDDALKVVKWLAKRGVRVEWGHSENRDTLLHEAVCQSSVRVAKWLLEQDVDIDAEGNGGYTPLHKAAQNGVADMVRFLIEHHANVDCQTASASTNLPIHDAARSNNLDIVRMLIDSGADIARPDDDGKTLLHYAAFWGACDLAERAVECGIDVNVQSNKGETPLHEAARRDERNMARWLILRGADVNAPTFFYYNTPLHEAVLGSFDYSVGSASMAECLIAAGADIDAQGRHGNTPLDFVLQRAQYNFAAWLVKLGASVDTKDEHGSSPLHRACAHRRSYELVEALIRHDAEIQAKDNDGDMPIHYAARGGSLEIMKFLVEQGADINATSGDGNTPLHYVARRDSTEMVEWFVKRGADLDTKNNDGETPLDVAKEDHIKDALRNHGAKSGSRANDK